MIALNTAFEDAYGVRPEQAANTPCYELLAETATDLAPPTMIETLIRLKPREAWRPGLTLDDLVAELDALVRFPGLTNAWIMPIKTRIDMLSTGIKTPVGVKG